MLNEDLKFNPLVCQNYNFLKILAKTKSINKRKKLLNNITAEQLLILAEICLNIVRNRFKLTNKQRKRMIPYAQFIRKMARARSSIGAKKLVQKGNGFGPAIFSALLTPIILEISKKIFSKNVSE